MVIKTSVEAQNRFGELLDLAQSRPVAITRRGRTVAYVISPDDMQDLERAKRRKRSKAAAAYEAWRAKYAGHISPEAASLTDEDIVRMVHEARDEAAHPVR